MNFISDNTNLKEKTIDAINKINKIVSSTFGPNGMNVLIKKESGNFLTKDGATVIKNLSFDEPFQDSILQIFRLASLQVASLAGDGTTTCTILAANLLKNLISKNDLNIPKVIKELKHLLFVSSEFLRNKSKNISGREDLLNVAKISSNGDTNLAELVTSAVERIGTFGTILIETSGSNESFLDVQEGYNIDIGLASKEFINDERRNLCHHDMPRFLVTDISIDERDQIIPIFDFVNRDKRPLIIVADNIKKDMLAAILLARMKHNINITVVNPPSYGEERIEIMKDICTFTGAKFFRKINDDKLENFEMKDLGFSRIFEGTKLSSSIIDGNGESQVIAERVEQLNNELQNEPIIENKLRLSERIARLTSIVAIIKVGGYSEAEVIEKKFRIEDAIEAVKSALLEGILPGAGTTLNKLAEHLRISEENIEVLEEFCEVLETPQDLLEKTSGLDHDFYDISNTDFGFGFDYANEKFGNMYEMGIIDATKVVRIALEQAVEIVNILLTCGGYINGAHNGAKGEK